MTTLHEVFEPLTFAHGPAMKNRFMLAPMTNCQSYDDGRLSDDEYQWLVRRALGGFGLVMTCASHVQAVGRGFPGQLGNFDEVHLPGLTRLAAGIKAAGSLAVTQLHHAGMRSPAALIGGAPVGASDDAATGTRGLSTAEVVQLAEDFIAAAVRADRAGFDGVELHGAHGYVICQFLSPETNRRTDRYGGSPENRARLLFDIIDGVRARCRPDLSLGVRLSPERFGLRLEEICAIAQRLMTEARIDYVDMSLWDVHKEPEEEVFRGRSLISYFTVLDRGPVRLGVAGKITRAADVRHCIDAGADFVLIGRAAILHKDFPQRVRDDPGFVSMPLPVSIEHLRNEGLGPAFIDYMRNWKGFVAA